MIERIHKDLLGTGGKDKFHIDELVNSEGTLLSELLVDAEIGSNANGHYIKSKNGLGFCWREVTIDRATTSDGGNVGKPIIFEGGFPHASGLNVGYGSTSGLDRIDAWRMMHISYADSWSFGRNYRDFTNWQRTGILNLRLWAFGIVE